MRNWKKLTEHEPPETPVLVRRMIECAPDLWDYTYDYVKFIRPAALSPIIYHPNFYRIAVFKGNELEEDWHDIHQPEILEWLNPRDIE